jgi:hypothetical protein
VPITPLTSNGVIKVNLSGYTALEEENDTSFYFDNFSILYPAGYQLNLGGMDLWDRALPITPPISTNLSALDVWGTPKSILTGAGTIGKHVKQQLDINDILLAK